jgi:hypothetical protein
MGVYLDVMFNETTARTSETQMLAGNTATAGKYTPKYDGKLVLVSLWNTPQAATSLCEAGYVKLLQEDWRPNTIIFPFGGYGLQTVSTGPVLGNLVRTDYVVDLAVSTSKQIDSLLFENDSPVTPRIRVIGTFTN